MEIKHPHVRPFVGRFYLKLHKLLFLNNYYNFNGGEEGIRTLERR